MRDYSLIVGALGIGWLVWLVVRNPRTINLQEFAAVRGERGLMLNNETFNNRVIEGPATVYMDDGTVISGNYFEGTSYAEVKAGERVFGAIGLKNCVITQCTLRNIGFVGTSDTVKKLREHITPTSLPTDNRRR